MKDFLLSFLKVLGIILALLVFLFVLQELWILNYSFFAPRYQNAQRHVFENTQSYVEGKRQELQKEYLEFAQSKDPSSKQAIASIVVHDFANFDISKLDSVEQGYFDTLRSYNWQ